MDKMLQDLRFSVRTLIKSPGVTAVAVLSLALGIGANATIFTLINAVFLNPLPVKRGSELAAVYTTDESFTGLQAAATQLSFPNFEDFRDENRVFSGLAAYSGPQGQSLIVEGEPEQVFVELVTADYFRVLGIEPARGRFFLPEEDESPGAYPVAVMGHGLWERRFGGDPGVVGRTVTLNGHPFTVVGIAPAGFKGIQAIGGAELWVPTMMYQQVLPAQFQDWFDDRRALLFNAVGRLKEGVTLEQARVNLETIAHRLEQEYPEPNKGRGAGVRPLNEVTIFPGFRQYLVLGAAVLMTVVGLVLLIACSNVANLLLAKAASRRKEIAVRLSLGAPRGRLVRQLLTESVVLALTGGLVALGVAWWGRSFLFSFRPTFLPANLFELPIDARVLGFTFVVALLTGLVFGLVPALQASRPEVVEDLKEDTRTSSGGGGGLLSLRGMLVVAQVALSFVALIAAGLFLRSLGGAHDIDPGFDTENLAVVVVNPGQNGYDQPRGEDFYRRLVERVDGLPEVASASLASNLPLFGGFQRTTFVEGQDTADKKAGKLTLTNTVDVGYFGTVDVPLLRGRDFTAADREGSLPVAIVNQEAANRFWPGEAAVGKRFKFYGDDFFRQVVGVARNAKYFTLGEDPQPCIYVPLGQGYQDAMTLYVRSASGDPGAALGAAQRAVRELDRGIPQTFALTVDGVIDQSLWASRVGASLLTVLGGLALLLAAVGLYGVLAYTVRQRTREIGIRMAIGAQSRDVLGLIVRQAMLLVAVGMGAGLVAALLVSRVVSTLLYGISPTDPLTFGAVIGVLAAVAVASAYVPAFRASHVEPVIALRE
jgi:predicted permease